VEREGLAFSRRSGQYPSEDAVVEAALRALRTEETSAAVEDLIDASFVAYCAREGDDTITLDEVRAATASIPGSMAQAIINEERAERF
jgi:Arc/MetJ-type ribon-helix-helix transcriptional regulator